MKISYKAIVWTLLAYGVAIYGIIYHYETKYLLFAFFLHLVIGLGITLGAHRAFSHNTFHGPPIVYNVLAFLYLLSFDRCGQPLLSWIVQHRMHHQHTDTDKDPHSPIHGFWWAFCGHHIFRNEEHWNEKIYMAENNFRDEKYHVFFAKIANSYFWMWATQLILVVFWSAIGFYIGGFKKAIDFVVWFVFIRFVISQTLHGFLDTFNHGCPWPLSLIQDTYGTKTRAINQFVLWLLQGGNETTHNRHHAWPNIAGQKTTWKFWEQDADAIIMWILEKYGIIKNCKWLSEKEIKNRKYHAKRNM